MTAALFANPLFLNVFPYLLLLVCILLVAALGALTRWLHLKAQNQKQSTVIAALANLSQAAQDAVVFVESELRPQVTTLTTDGKISPQAGMQLRNTAVTLAEKAAKGFLAQVVGTAGIKDPRAVLEPMVDAAAARVAGNSRNAAAQSTVLQGLPAAMRAQAEAAPKGATPQ